MKALLNEEGMKIWGFAFPNGGVPVKNVASQKAEVEGLGELDVYLVDWAALTEEQRKLILCDLKSRFEDSETAVEAEILKSGLPLRASLVSCVSIPVRYF